MRSAGIYSEIHGTTGEVKTNNDDVTYVNLTQDEEGYERLRNRQTATEL